MTLFEFFALMGGVGLFLFGMSIMSTGLKNAAGDKMKTILEHATSNRFVSVAVGVVVTLLIQSSSATDMMVISFVNSGLMTLLQAIGVIMGANIGTTITAQITAFNLGAIAPAILFIGAVAYLFVKSNTVRHVGSIIMGFGMLFFGISVIKSAITPLSQSAEFISFLSTLANPAVALVFGVLFTALLQSSSSSVVIFQTFAVQGLIGFDMTVYLVIGAAIGSVTPNILASLTTNRDGKRTAALNLLFNLIRAALMVLLISIFPSFLDLIRNLTPDSIGHQVANVHTIFAILAVLLELPFAGFIVRLSRLVVPVLPEESRKLEDRKLKYMVHDGDIPAFVAMQQAKMEIIRLGRITRKGLQDSLTCFFTHDDKLGASLQESEDTVGILADQIQDRLITLRSMPYKPRTIEVLSQLLLAVTDMERIADHARNIAGYEAKYRERSAVISETGMKELKDLADLAMKSIDKCLDIFETERFWDIPDAYALRQQVAQMQTDVVNSHINRLMKSYCEPVGGVIFTDLSSDLERCADHAMNIATALSD